MRASRKVDYALRAMGYLAALPRDRVTLVTEIAESQNIPRDFLSKILKDLVNRGLLRSHLGPGGGYSLARDPKDISFFDVHEAIEGALLVMDCGQGADACSQIDSCTQLPVWRELEHEIQRLFQGVTMDDIKQHVLCPQRTTPRGGSSERDNGERS
jgi:Rrf2 family protein